MIAAAVPHAITEGAPAVAGVPRRPLIILPAGTSIPS